MRDSVTKACAAAVALAAAAAAAELSPFPRLTTAKRVEVFDEGAVRAEMSKRATDDWMRTPFMLSDALLRASTHTSIDVRRDSDTLYVSFLWFTAGREGPCTPGTPTGDGTGVTDGLEVIFTPRGDRLGFIQFGLAGTEKWMNCYWPYRDGKRDFTRNMRFEATWLPVVKYGEVNARFVTFRFRIDEIAAEESRGLVGFNAMRTDLKLAENAVWSHLPGAGFSCGSGNGWLRLADDAPQPAETVAGTPAAERRLAEAKARNRGRRPKLQVTYDWPDEMVGGPYDKATLEREFRYLKGKGVSRIYWIDYPGLEKGAEPDEDGMVHLWRHHRTIMSNLTKTVANFGEDPLFFAVKTAHRLGLEFYTVVKPYDLHTGTPRAAAPEGCTFAGVPVVGGRLYPWDHFVRRNPQFGFRRNPAWRTAPYDAKLTKVTVFNGSDEAFPFKAEEAELYTSMDNLKYTKTSAKASLRLVERPVYEWTPAGNRATAGRVKVRALEFTGIPGAVRYAAVKFPAWKGPWRLRNARYLALEVEDENGPVAVTFSQIKRGQNAGVSKGGDFRECGFEFYHDGGSACWSDTSEYMENVFMIGPGGVLAFGVGQDEYRPDMPDPSHPEVQDHFVEFFVKRAVAAGADGVDVRIAHHHCCQEWLSYAYAEPVLKTFRERFGREPKAEFADYGRIRRIRGEGHTAFLRKAAALLHASGRKLHHHFEARMITGPEYDTYCQIHWDWKTWLEEGIVDGLSLKYVGPFNWRLDSDVLPLARGKGAEVNMVSAPADPRIGGAPALLRAPEVGGNVWDLCRDGGLDAMNVYETWVYLRTTPDGDWMFRGAADLMFDTWRRRVRGE
ncbi:MAG: hypothetical protein J6T01_02825 [Kiritimatiellae bacterium]|nr:hypothetical protein [Kiritimatiellia bacterium]